MSKAHGPLLQLTRLYERESQAGNVYFRGRLGGCRLLLLQTGSETDDGAVIWNLFLQQVPFEAMQE